MAENDGKACPHLNILHVYWSSEEEHQNIISVLVMGTEMRRARPGRRQVATHIVPGSAYDSGR